MKKIIFIIGIFAVILIVFSLKLLSNEDDWICRNGQWIKHGNPSAPMPTKPCSTGQSVNCKSYNAENCPFECVVCPPCAACSSISCQAANFCQEIGFDKNWYESIKKQIYDFNTCVAAGNSVTEYYPKQCRDAEGNLYIEDIGNELDKTDLIQVNIPRPNQIISSPLFIEGNARGFWFFEGEFSVKLLEQKGNILATGIATANGEWMTENFVPFTAKLEFNALSDENGTLILEKDNPSDLPENADQLIIPVVFTPTPAIVNVKAYFNNNKLDPDISCNKVFSVERAIPKTAAIARAALEELLKGPTVFEQKSGFLTNINPGVKIQKLSIEGETAKVDFDEQLEFQVGGSCRVSAIRSQITETLKQFSAVKEVIISINGRAEDILQP